MGKSFGFCTTQLIYFATIKFYYYKLILSVITQLDYFKCDDQGKGHGIGTMLPILDFL